MSRTVLIILAALAAAIVIGVLAWRTFGGRDVAEGETPRIAIVTDTLLRAAADANAMDEQRLAWLSSVRQQGLQRMEASGGTIASQAQKATAAEAAEPSTASANQAAFLRDALTDELEAQINKMLTNSQRFAVMDASSVRSAIERLSAANTKEAREKSEQKQPTAGGAIGQAVVQAVQGSVQVGTTQASGTVQSKGGSVTYQDTQIVDTIERGDLAGAAADLDARYLLAASLREPKTTYEISETEGGYALRIEADPVFVYRLFDVRTNRTVVSDATQLDAPVAVEVKFPSPSDWLAKENFNTEVTKALRELSTKVQARVGRHISDAVLEATFPALLASGAPLVMNRGSNDGVEVGEEVSITRRGAEIKDGDIVIDHEETPVGTARVVSVKANSARLEAISGSNFAKNDIVRRTGGRGASAVVAPVADGGSARGLGREDILANRANAGVVRERVAVSSIRIVRDDSRIFGPSLQMDRAIAERLARDPRIEVMSRESLGALEDERAIGGARKTYERGGAGGVGKAGYLVLGDVTVDVKRSAEYIDVPGAAKREVSSTTRMVANGSLRIERLDSRIIGSFEVSASAPIAGGGAGDAESARKLAAAFADEAARQILPRLFPMEVVQVQGASVVLNRGADVGIRKGATYAVFAIGDPIVDSTTGAQISAGVRRQVGTVRIEDVQANVSVASLVSGAVAVGQIAEASTASASASAGEASPRRPATARKEEKKADELAAPF